MRIGICFFIDSNLGGAATQADDMVTVGKRLGHDTCLIRFAHSERCRELFDVKSNRLPIHKLKIGRTGMRFNSERVLLTPNTIDQVVFWLNTFDVLIFVGGCPHITRTFSESDFFDKYQPLYEQVCCSKYMFFTDPFWKDLYPYCNQVVGFMDGVYAFAEAYRRSVLETGLNSDVKICKFGSVLARDMVDALGTSRTDSIIWPHQWRSWKNPKLFIKMIPLFKVPVRAYADGIEYYKLRRDQWDCWYKAFSRDEVKNQNLSNDGNGIYYGTVPQQSIMKEFTTCRWMIDLTGMSGRTGKPIPKYVGNYQCVNLECMMLGCVNFKYANTVEPNSCVPQECVVSMPLDTNENSLSKFINARLHKGTYNTISKKAKQWAVDNFDPFKVFEDFFLN